MAPSVLAACVQLWRSPVLVVLPDYPATLPGHGTEVKESLWHRKCFAAFPLELIFIAEVYSLNELRECYQPPNTHPNTSCCPSSFIHASSSFLPFLRLAQAVRQCVMCCPGWIRREKKQRKAANQEIGVLWQGQYVAEVSPRPASSQEM